MAKIESRTLVKNKFEKNCGEFKILITYDVFQAAEYSPFLLGLHFLAL